MATTGNAPVGAENAADAANNGPAGSGEGEFAELEQPVAPDSKYNANGRRDPFISPVVSKAGGFGMQHRQEVS